MTVCKILFSNVVNLCAKNKTLLIVSILSFVQRLHLRLSSIVLKTSPSFFENVHGEIFFNSRGVGLKKMIQKKWNKTKWNIFKNNLKCFIFISMANLYTRKTFVFEHFCNCVKCFFFFCFLIKKVSLQKTKLMSGFVLFL